MLDEMTRQTNSKFALLNVNSKTQIFVQLCVFLNGEKQSSIIPIVIPSIKHKSPIIEIEKCLIILVMVFLCIFTSIYLL